ncbi:MAG: hypothetical protein WEA04_02400 [Candidatus Andersenbacteria bacterium]
MRSLAVVVLTAAVWFGGAVIARAHGWGNYSYRPLVPTVYPWQRYSYYHGYSYAQPYYPALTRWNYQPHYYPYAYARPASIPVFTFGGVQPAYRSGWLQPAYRPRHAHLQRAYGR